MRTLKLIMVVLVVGIIHQIGNAQANRHDVEISPERASVLFSDQTPSSFLIEIAGPGNYYWQQSVNKTNEITINNQKSDGTKFPDGQYTMQITPVFQMSDEQKQKLHSLRLSGDMVALKNFRLDNNLPDQIGATVVNFSIHKGLFVSPKTKESGIGILSSKNKWEYAHPSLYANISHTVVDFPERVIDNSWKMEDDAQVFVDDVIVIGSLCVGQDCVNGENFGFDTQRLKENNLRLHFDDTSNSGSFPFNDWRIVANDSSNGGASYLAFEDSTAGTIPFSVAAGAGNNALVVSNSGGNVGMGTATPVLELHITDGDTPTMRLEQNGASGWTPQTWDVAGNETNFFVRDVTNGSKLPFKIRPGAPDNSLYVHTDGKIAFGNQAPTHALDIMGSGLRLRQGDIKVDAGKIGIGVNPTVALDVLGNVKVTGTTTITGDANFRGNITGFSPASVSFKNAFGFPILHIDAVQRRVGIGTITPSHQLELTLDDAVKPNGGSWTAPSDRRLKKDIVSFKDGLNVLSQLNPVSYRYNGKLDLPSDQTFIGMIAQEVQTVAPYMVKPLNDQSDLGKTENFLAFDPSTLSYVLINSVKEQQEIIASQQQEIETLKDELIALRGLNEKFAELSAKVDLLSSDRASNEEKVSEERD